MNTFRIALTIVTGIFFVLPVIGLFLNPGQSHEVGTLIVTFAVIPAIGLAYLTLAYYVPRGHSRQIALTMLALLGIGGLSALPVVVGFGGDWWLGWLATLAISVYCLSQIAAFVIGCCARPQTGH